MFIAYHTSLDYRLPCLMTIISYYFQYFLRMSADTMLGFCQCSVSSIYPEPYVVQRKPTKVEALMTTSVHAGGDRMP